jgi:predicted LPLAT superfamily acyltransferase
MPQWEGKSKGNPLGYRIFVFVLRKLGVVPAYILLRFVAFYYFLFSWSTSSAIYDYFRERLGFSPVKAWLKIYSNYYILGQTLIDKITVMASLPNPFTFVFEGEENLHDIAAQGKGGILLSAHIGSWEAAGHLLHRLRTRINVVMFDGEHQNIKKYMTSVTGGPNFNVIVIKNDMSHVYAIGDALAKNELVCLHADRFLPGNKTIVRPILGSDAEIPEGPFAMAAAFNVPVSVVFGFKETMRHYHLFGSTPLLRRPDESKPEFRERLINAFIAEVDQKIRMYPEQWFNYYKFWKN